MNFQKSKFAGGIARLWILPLQYYNGVKFNATSGLYYPLGIKGKLTDVPFSIDSCSYSIKKKGSAYDVNISCFIPGISFYNLQASIDLESTPFLIIVRDYNNNFMLFGDYDNFFLYNPDLESNEDYSEPAGINFSFSRTMLNMPLLIEDPFVNNKPVASNVIISGSGSVGETLTGQYFYHDDDGDSEGNSMLKWYQSDDENGTNKVLISTGQTLVLSENNKGKFIQFSVIPHDGTSFGNEAYSEYLEIVDYIIPNSFFDGMSIESELGAYSISGSGNLITINQFFSDLSDQPILFLKKALIPNIYTKKIRISLDVKKNMTLLDKFITPKLFDCRIECHLDNDPNSTNYQSYENIYISDSDLVDEWESYDITIDSSYNWWWDIFYFGFAYYNNSNLKVPPEQIAGLKIEIRINSITYY
ncbi:hypothetical protein ACT29H_09345 [Thermophagus sp. OGC60D27]|uniref:hypothetical protein n=1 Tax=Thermophagus sp. OGC60D27 TaxID=3458415 RepID=UPI004037A052